MSSRDGVETSLIYDHRGGNDDAGTRRGPMSGPEFNARRVSVAAVVARPTAHPRRTTVER